MRRFLSTLLLMSGLVAAGGADAVQQCFYDSGTVGSITVTRNCTGSVSNYAPFDGTSGSVFLSTPGSSCTFSFSPSVSSSVSSLESQILAVNTSETASFELNGSPYTLSSADVDNTLNPPIPGAFPLILGGANDVTSAGNYANGTVIFGTAPASVSSVQVTSSSGGVLATVCFDDPVTPPTPPTPPQPIPTLSEWAQIMMMLAMIATAGFYGWRMKQR